MTSQDKAMHSGQNSCWRKSHFLQNFNPVDQSHRSRKETCNTHVIKWKGQTGIQGWVMLSLNCQYTQDYSGWKRRRKKWPAACQYKGLGGFQTLPPPSQQSSSVLEKGKTKNGAGFYLTDTVVFSGEHSILIYSEYLNIIQTVPCLYFSWKTILSHLYIKHIV